MTVVQTSEHGGDLVISRHPIDSELKTLSSIWFQCIANLADLDEELVRCSLFFGVR